MAYFQRLQQIEEGLEGGTFILKASFSTWTLILSCVINETRLANCKNLIAFYLIWSSINTNATYLFVMYSTYCFEPLGTEYILQKTYKFENFYDSWNWPTETVSLRKTYRPFKKTILSCISCWQMMLLYSAALLHWMVPVQCSVRWFSLCL